jgi:hypothetical protein
MKYIDTSLGDYEILNPKNNIDFLKNKYLINDDNNANRTFTMNPPKLNKTLTQTKFKTQTQNKTKAKVKKTIPKPKKETSKTFLNSTTISNTKTNTPKVEINKDGSCSIIDKIVIDLRNLK